MSEHDSYVYERSNQEITKLVLLGLTLAGQQAQQGEHHRSLVKPEPGHWQLPG